MELRWIPYLKEVRGCLIGRGVAVCCSLTGALLETATYMLLNLLLQSSNACRGPLFIYIVDQSWHCTKQNRTRHMRSAHGDKETRKGTCIGNGEREWGYKIYAHSKTVDALRILGIQTKVHVDKRKHEHKIVGKDFHNLHPHKSCCTSYFPDVVVSFRF